MSRILALVILLVLGSKSSEAQVRFTASTDARQVVVNGVFEVRFTLENAEGREFQAPPFDGFEVVSGPSLSMSTTILNGQRTQSRSYGFTLMATREGTFTIAGAKIKSGTQVLESNSLTVEVVAGKPGSSVDGQVMPTDEQVFVRLAIDTAVAHPGQQLRLDYKLYTTVNIRNYNTIQEDSYEDFFFRYVKDFNERAYLEVVDGIQYRVQTLKSLALFPQKTGSITIDPLVINAGIGVRDQRRSFFFNTRTIPKTLRSNGLSLEVLPLPDPQPGDFTGAVGRYQMAVQTNRRELTSDDALVLTVQIAGDGDAKRWSPPSLAYLDDRFEMYDPRIIQDRFVDVGGRMESAKTIEYLLIPRKAGPLTFHVDFTYYDIDSSGYVTLRSNPVSLTVRPGTGRSSEESLMADEMQVRDITGLQSRGRTPRVAPVFLFSPTYLVLSLLPFL
ncbi:MAG: BatD family protein, partial [Saprospiraceae bacterium]|nr:BatD family protein [Saprospiraceae bacterium]